LGAILFLRPSIPDLPLASGFSLIPGNPWTIKLTIGALLWPVMPSGKIFQPGNFPGHGRKIMVKNPLV
jgi:hypothetical protein